MLVLMSMRASSGWPVGTINEAMAFIITGLHRTARDASSDLSLRVAKTNHDAVAERSRDRTVELGHGFRTTCMVGLHDVPEVFGVETCCKGEVEPDEIAEQQLPTRCVRQRQPLRPEVVACEK